jgi:hypothetical protein
MPANCQSNPTVPMEAPEVVKDYAALYVRMLLVRSKTRISRGPPDVFAMDVSVGGVGMTSGGHRDTF